MEADGEKFWRRSMLGNELVVAKRLAGEEEEGEEEQEDEFPELTQMEYLVLLAVAHGSQRPEEIEEYIANALPTVGPPLTSPGMMVLILVKLREKKLISDPGNPKLLRAGTRLLASRGVL